VFIRGEAENKGEIAWVKELFQYYRNSYRAAGRLRSIFCGLLY